MLDVQKYSYHSHTNFSDGKSTALEMVRQAKALGWTSLGISDHLIVHKNMRQSPSCSINKYMQLEPHIYNVSFADIREKFLRHCEALRQLAKAENFAVRIGFEVDFFTYDGWLEELDDCLAQLDYDYVITGNHFAFDAACETIYNLTDLPVLSNDKAWLNELLQRHFVTMKQAVDSRRFKFWRTWTMHVGLVKIFVVKHRSRLKNWRFSILWLLPQPVWKSAPKAYAALMIFFLPRGF